MRRMKLMSKKLLLILATAGMLLTSGMPVMAFANATEDETDSRVEEVVEETEVTVLPETDTSEEEGEEGIDRGDAFTVPGTAEVQDDITSGSKEFLTIQTKNNQTFYVIIDRASTNDNVYMLSNVDEDDLQEFLKEDSKKEEEKPAVVLPEKVVDEETAKETEPVKEEKETQSSASPAMAVILIAALGGLAGYYYFKIYKPKKEQEDDSDNEGLEEMESTEEVDEDE